MLKDLVFFRLTSHWKCKSSFTTGRISINHMTVLNHLKWANYINKRYEIKQTLINLSIMSEILLHWNKLYFFPKRITLQVTKNWCYRRIYFKSQAITVIFWSYGTYFCYNNSVPANSAFQINSIYYFNYSFSYIRVCTKGT